jgi:ATP-binding cassette subfamily B protein
VHVLPQESFLFSDTLEQNLRLCAPRADEEDLARALRLSVADEVIARLDKGLETQVGDRGVTLRAASASVCLARAILSGADILVLDDATSALDAATERRAIANIRALRSQGRGAAHHADRVQPPVHHAGGGPGADAGGWADRGGGYP